jgi:N-acyl-phosphatidylethanolamine-hydrolysing phospholipase D
VPDTTPPTVPVIKPTFLPTRSTSTLRATWLGHACYFVEFPSGFRVLFDPVFSERCSPFSWLGPKRYTEIPCQIEEIPIVDAVVISHNHYDHMDHPTIMKIKARHANVHFFVPLGNKKWFLESGFTAEQVTELDWWQERDIKLSTASKSGSIVSKDTTSSLEDTPGSASIAARIGCLPCQHTSARSGFDKGLTLWASWSVESGDKRIWFGGDTGYRAVPELPKGVDDYGEGHNYPHCPAFEQIGKLRGPFDLGLIPIGAYDPRFIMSPMHANPFDSVNIFKDTKCKRAMGIHWGTWVLTEEDVLEPPMLLKRALKQSGIAEEGVFDVCDIGESREFI